MGLSSFILKGKYMEEKNVLRNDRKNIFKGKLPIIIMAVGALMVLIGILCQNGVIC